MTKALVLMSGGLDSMLAARILQEQCEVIGICFESPFFGCEKAKKAAEQLAILLKIIKLGKKYYKMLRKPKHGYGSAMNPCIDCHAFMLKLARKMMRREKADFIATGEVLNERPMSQTLKSLEIVEKESGLSQKLLRPLSAKLLPETEIEKKGLVDRSKLLDISGRSRKKQMELAEKYKLSYPAPAGGCLLCEKEFGKKLAELFSRKKRVSENDLEMLKYGRHFWHNKSRIIVGRNEQENNKLLELKGRRDFALEAADIPGPIVILQGKDIAEAARLAARYSDAAAGSVSVKYGRKNLNDENHRIFSMPKIQRIFKHKLITVKKE